ncbi:MAG: hypothetical protein JW910_21360 [Anaerolineae bacterium]|nr:hypothetical protein [Anaerolineae bacterium]
MRTYLLVVLVVIGLLIPPGMTASGGPPIQAAPESDLLRLMRFIPDAPEYTEWVSYGDIAAWHTSWNIPRLDNLDDLDALDRDPRAYWMFIMPRQTFPRDVLGAQYLMQSPMRPFYGFDLFNADRFISAGMPPVEVAVIEHNLDNAAIAAALTASGYEVKSEEPESTLYGFLEDNESALALRDTVPRVGLTGALNRIALLDGGPMIIARATGLVTTALGAQRGDTPSLADNVAFRAAALALEDPFLADTGELVGAMLFDAAAFEFDDPFAVLGAHVTSEQLEELRERYRLDEVIRLFSYQAVALATRHTEGATYLIVAAVFTPGTDAAHFAGVLGARMQDYVSLQTQQPLSDRWTFDRASGVTVEGQPVGLVVMRVPDPPIAPEGEMANAAVFSWIQLEAARDYLFLSPYGLPEEAPPE